MLLIVAKKKFVSDMSGLDLDCQRSFFNSAIILGILSVSNLVQLVLPDSPVEELGPLFSRSEYPEEEDEVKSLNNAHSAFCFDNCVII